MGATTILGKCWRLRKMFAAVQKYLTRHQLEDGRVAESMDIYTQSVSQQLTTFEECCPKRRCKDVRPAKGTTRKMM
jgi:hypothetical protein